MQKRKIIYQLWRDLYAVYVFLFVYVIGWAHSRLHYPYPIVIRWFRAIPFIHSSRLCFDSSLSLSLSSRTTRYVCIVCMCEYVAAVFDFHRLFFHFHFDFDSISFSFFSSCSFISHFHDSFLALFFHTLFHIAHFVVDPPRLSLQLTKCYRLPFSTSLWFCCCCCLCSHFSTIIM